MFVEKKGGGVPALVVYSVIYLPVGIRYLE